MKNFNIYDADNPSIYESFKKFTFEAKQKGFKHYSAKGIFELIRWHTPIKGNDQFKVNNNYHAYYARKLMKEFPEYEGFFITRKVNYL